MVFRLPRIVLGTVLVTVSLWNLSTERRFQSAYRGEISELEDEIKLLDQMQAEETDNLISNEEANMVREEIGKEREMLLKLEEEEANASSSDEDEEEDEGETAEEEEGPGTQAEETPAEEQSAALAEPVEKVSANKEPTEPAENEPDDVEQVDIPPVQSTSAPKPELPADSPKPAQVPATKPQIANENPKSAPAQKLRASVPATNAKDKKQIKTATSKTKPAAPLAPAPAPAAPPKDKKKTKDKKKSKPQEVAKAKPAIPSTPAPTPAAPPKDKKQTKPKKTKAKAATPSTPAPAPVTKVDEKKVNPADIGRLPEDKRRDTFFIDNIKSGQGSVNATHCDYATDRFPCLCETHYQYGNDFSIKDIANGKGSNARPLGDVWPAKKQKKAVCKLVEEYSRKPRWSLLNDIPHHLQELYRCMTWWQMNKKQKPVLVSPLGHPPKKPYLIAFYQALKDHLGVEIVYNDAIPKGQKHIAVAAPISHFNTMLSAYVFNREAVDAYIPLLLDKVTSKNKRTAGCPAPKSRHPKPTIVVLNREGSRRILENHVEVMAALKEAFPHHNVRYQPNFEDKSFEEQVQFMTEVDILIGPHGQQFQSVPFMPQCGSLIELFNHGYYMPNFFGSLAGATGHHHFFSYGGGSTGRKTLGRTRKREFFYASPEHVVKLAQAASKKWSSCCKDGFRGIAPPPQTGTAKS